MTTTASPIDHAHTSTHPDAILPRWHRAWVGWFDAAKGFGFLTPDTGPAVFVDYSVIDVPGYKNLTAGQPVIYTATDSGRGPEATRVIPYPHTIAGHHHRTPGTALRRSRCRARAA